MGIPLKGKSFPIFVFIVILFFIADGIIVYKLFIYKKADLINKEEIKFISQPSKKDIILDTFPDMTENGKVYFYRPLHASNDTKVGSFLKGEILSINVPNHFLVVGEKEGASTEISMRENSKIIVLDIDSTSAEKNEKEIGFESLVIGDMVSIVGIHSEAEGSYSFGTLYKHI